MNKSAVLLALVSVVVGLAACTATRPLSLEELKSHGDKHVNALDLKRWALDRPVTLERAMAFAVEGNERLRIEALNGVIAKGGRRITSASMLPDVAGSAGYHSRNNDQGSFSRNLQTGGVSLESSTSSERQTTSAQLEAHWNVIDFGIAWLSARTYGDKERVAEEERRRVQHQIAVDIIFAWDKALAFQRIRPQLDEARKGVEDALAQSTAMRAQRVRDPLLELEYHSALLLILKRISALSLEMDQARDDLAELLGMPAGTALVLDDSTDVYTSFQLPSARLMDWQYVALVERPEMRQAIYDSRNSRREARKAVFEALPSIALTYGMNYDSNSFLYNNHWQDSSAALSFSLIKLATLPMRHRVGRQRIKVAELQEQLLATAILSQVSIAQKARAAAEKTACLSSSLSRLDDEKLGYLRVRSAAAAVDQLTMVRESTDNILLTLEAAMDRASKRRAELMLASAVGIGAMPDELDGQSLDERARAISGWMTTGMRERAATVLAEVIETSPSTGTDKAAAGSKEAVPGIQPVENPSEECIW